MSFSRTYLLVSEIAAPIPNAVIGGPFGSNLVSKDYAPEGIPVIRGINLSDGRWVNGDFVFVSPEKASQLIANTARPGDVVFTQRGTLGQVAIVPEQCYDRYIVSQSQMKLTVDPTKADRFYVYYYFRSEEYLEYLDQHTIQTGVPHINLGILRNTPIPLPPLPIQRRIAEILGRLDDKIEVNRRINRTLEAMAQALYKHWFVDFGPFQDGPFVESELGPIPEGWRIEYMRDCAEAVKGLSYKGAYLAESGMPLHNLNSIYEGGGYKYEGIKYYTGEYKPRHVVKPGDVIIANTEQGFEYLLIGCPAIVPRFFGEEGLFSHHLFRLRPYVNSSLSTYHLYCLLKDRQFRSSVTAFTNGTTVNMLSTDGLSWPQIIVPTPEVSERFQKVIAPYFKQAEVNYEESQKLAEIRDYLLPKLLSGEIAVEASEKVA